MKHIGSDDFIYKHSLIKYFLLIFISPFLYVFLAGIVYWAVGYFLMKRFSRFSNKDDLISIVEEIVIEK